MSDEVPENQQLDIAEYSVELDKTKMGEYIAEFFEAYLAELEIFVTIISPFNNKKVNKLYLRT